MNSYSCVLITGCAGFIGFNFTQYIIKKYPNVHFIGLDKISYCSNLKATVKLDIDNSNFDFIKCNLLNMKNLKTVFKDNKIDVVIHFAAYTHVDLSFGNSIKFTKNNVLATHYLLEVSKSASIKRFLHISTDEVYGSKDTISTENSILDPTNPYSATKAGAEQLVKSYYHSYKLPIIITRGNNVYGPYQYPDKLIPLFILNLHQKEKCNIQGSGQQLRSFLYITDAIKAFETVLLKGKVSEIYNIGSDNEISVLGMQALLCKKFKCVPQAYLQFVKDRPFNDHRYNLDCTKLKNLGWKQEIDLDTGLDESIKWYTHDYNRKNHSKM